MTAPAIQVPPLECPDVLLPTPANLANLFKGIITQIYRYPIDEFEELKEELEKIRKDILDIYDPKFEKIEIPELEWEIIITRLSAEYPMYVQQKILELINTVFPIEFRVTVLGITFDILEFLANPSSVLDNLELEEIDSVYDLIPDEFKVWEKFETADFKKESIRHYLRSEVAKKMNLLLTGGIAGIIDLFDEIWDALGLPSFPGLQEIDLIQLIKDKSIEELEQVQIFGFSLLDLLGGEFDDNVEIPEFQKERLLKRAREFEEEWQTYLIKKWINTVAKFFKAIGLGAVVDLLVFDFCDFLTLIGFPKTINLPDSIQTVVSETVNPFSNESFTLNTDDVDRFNLEEGQTIISGSFAGKKVFKSGNVGALFTDYVVHPSGNIILNSPANANEQLIIV